jgi:hypothetical protein
MNNIDVYVEGAYHNIEFKWIVECKAWRSNVPKEKAMTLMSILQDIEADRGFFEVSPLSRQKNVVFKVYCFERIPIIN